MRTVLFTGSRGWRDAKTIAEAIDSIRQPFRGIVGDADGFDKLVWEALTERSLPRLRFKAKWRENGYYNRGAGHDRNRLMAAWLALLDDSGFCVAGWDGQSSGTAGCIKEVERLGLDVWRLHYVPSLNKREE